MPNKIIDYDRTSTAPFCFHYKFRFSHADPFGYVFYPRYFECFHAATEEWFTHGLGLIFADLVIEQRVGQPTVHLECQFIKPCRLGDELEIAVILEKLGNTSLTLRYIGMVDGDIRVRATAVQVWINANTGKPTPFAPLLRERLEDYHARIIAPDDEAPERRG
jgi:4-hydroxybenzoyl-CoA thioesterase|tara:strand:+ start:491 stop:979 length:489 start_codon:yes stop_codon:yes gene_type:complete